MSRDVFFVSSSSFSHIACFSIPDKYNLLPINIHRLRAGYPTANSVTLSEYCVHRIILPSWVSISMTGVATRPNRPGRPPARFQHCPSSCLSTGTEYNGLIFGPTTYASRRTTHVHAGNPPTDIWLSISSPCPMRLITLITFLLIRPYSLLISRANDLDYSLVGDIAG